jgi:hypothetical protein
MRAKTIPHAEYEILRVILRDIDLERLRDAMSKDEVSTERFEKAATNVAKLVSNLADRRRHRLPEDHHRYRPKARK